MHQVDFPDILITDRIAHMASSPDFTLKPIAL
ncbi:Transposase [Caenorhabditis elegans]|uniref:Transposase n=2 Tax=Caenorhabditis elegans TaxID=6239 RepID=U4PRK7_CAEEL|nr:Transposase [Caenorhabditis elegans]CDH93211.1 Transposase [Caenorhabditis elegans]|eukprot:NP_001294762.1 Uncharacterized protein CELE_Y73C8B.9 [Caenorhabditis elegans]